MGDIKIVQPSGSVEVHFTNGKTFLGPRGTTVEEFIRSADLGESELIVGCVLNNELKELTTQITKESTLRPVTTRESDGARIYRRSLTYLLSAAFSHCFPGSKLYLDHSVFPNGYHCHVSPDLHIDDVKIEKLRNEMRRLISAEYPFVKTEIPLSDAIQIFSKNKALDKVELFKYKKKESVTLYTLDGFVDYQHGFMVPNTSYLRWFDLIRANGGFTLRFPSQRTPHQIDKVGVYPHLLNSFQQYGQWLNKLGIENVGALNGAITEGRIRELVLVSEAFHEQQIAEISGRIARNLDKNRVILISGPSSSGKTTFSRKLAIQLLSLGISPFAMELDNYFVDRDSTPKGDDGEFDFESIHALDLARLSEDLAGLIAGKAVRLPKYNFKSGLSEAGELIKLKPDQLIIMEGIHGLNPSLIQPELADHAFKIYVSALTQLNLDDQNRVSTTDTRLMRRIIRDNAQRGYNAAQTIARWGSVERAEKNHIFPYQENADVMFNSALVYETSVIKPIIEPLLRQVPFNTPEYIEAKRLMVFLEWFLPANSELVPDISILREFIGGSILHDFTVWRE